MADTANVRSIEALSDFRVALCKFVETARSSLGEADADLSRCGMWLSGERQPYWKSELSRRAEQLRKAKLVLLEKKLQKTATGGRPSCVDEEKAVALAQRRFEEAERKGANTRLWIRKLDEQIFHYKGMIQALNHALDVDAVNMLALLDRMISALDAYVALAPPPGVDIEPIASDMSRAGMTGGVGEPANQANPDEAENTDQKQEGTTE